jgi:hypothetical protein
MSEPVQNLFTINTIGTYAGASVAVMVVSNTIRALFKIESAWISFLVAIFISILGTFGANGIDINFANVGIAFLNACLLFFSATGIQTATVSSLTPKEAGTVRKFGKDKVKWFSFWFK